MFRRRTQNPLISLLLISILLLAPLHALAATPTAASFTTAVPVISQSVLQLQGADADGTPLVFAIVSAPAHGALSQLDTSTGAVVYTPAANYVGGDSFTYTVTSGGQTTSPATVTLTVTAATTRIIDTLTNPDGSPRTGKVTFFLTQVASSPGGIIPAKASVSAQLSSTGSYDVSLYPSRSVSPVQFYQMWFDGGNGSSQLLGIFDIPASTAAITLTGHRITDANLAAQYTFASKAEVDALTRAVAAATTAQLYPTLVAGKHIVWNGSTFGNSIISESGTTATVAGGLTVTGKITGDGSGITGLPTTIGADVDYPDVEGDSGRASLALLLCRLRGDCTAPVGASLNTGLSASWPLSGLSDSVGGLTLTNNYGVTFGTGLIGNAAQLTAASSQSLTAASGSAFPNSTSFTYAVWFQVTSTGSTYAILSKNNLATSAIEFGLLSTTTDGIVFNLFNGTLVKTGTPVSTNIWHLAVFGYNASTSQIFLSLDNNPSIVASAAPIARTAAPLAFGKESFNGFYLNGKLDEVSLWNARALSGTEITALYNSGAGRALPLTLTSQSFTFAPADLADNSRSTSHTTWYESSSFARAVFATSASSVTVTGYNNNTYYPLMVKVNGADWLLLNTTPPAGATSYTVPLPPGTKIVELVSSGIAGTLGDLGHFLTGATFDAPAVKLTPRAANLIIYGDSIAVGIGAGVETNATGYTASRDAWAVLLRRNYTGGVQVEGIAGRAFYDDGIDVAARTAFANRIASYAPKVFWDAIGTNDYYGAYWTAVAFGTAYGDLLDKMHAAAPNLRIYAQTPLVRTTETANSVGSTLGDYRTAKAAACAARPTYCSVVDGTQILALSDLFDGVHPGTIGHIKYAAFVRDRLGQ